MGHTWSVPRRFLPDSWVLAREVGLPQRFAVRRRHSTVKNVTPLSPSTLAVDISIFNVEPLNFGPQRSLSSLLDTNKVEVVDFQTPFRDQGMQFGIMYVAGKIFDAEGT
ncbi:hypothetical protein SCLCIDRAFT_1216822 [Scleroderma citrinum Foug A]|uniref:Uncharacterized protein n=1 Tax=Scleroderma citrinum Foug A TaxID=1036808 RepID=A0A0C3DXB5_9AGAM|nr:hypothetical protein SCLCIDRAFT_1216822 [Scleroderma citrinum Foug A]